METTLSPSTTTSAYPSLKQGWILLAMMIGSQILIGIVMAAPMLYAKSANLDLFGVLEFIAYVGAMGLTIWFALRERRSNALAWGAVPTKLYPVITLGTVALAVVLEPIISAVPTPAWLEELMKQAMTKNIILSAVVAAPIMEEVLMRGIVLDGFLKRYSPAKAIFWSAFLFGVMHLNPAQFMVGLLIGIPLGWLYYRTGSLWPGIFMHFVNNSLSSLGFLMLDEDNMDMAANTTQLWIGNDSVYYGLLVACVAVVVACYFVLDRMMKKTV
jgi:uncharacterized protein